MESLLRVYLVLAFGCVLAGVEKFAIIKDGKYYGLALTKESADHVVEFGSYSNNDATFAHEISHAYVASQNNIEVYSVFVSQEAGNERGHVMICNPYRVSRACWHVFLRLCQFDLYDIVDHFGLRECVGFFNNLESAAGGFAFELWAYNYYCCVEKEGIITDLTYIKKFYKSLERYAKWLGYDLYELFNKRYPNTALWSNREEFQKCMSGEDLCFSIIYLTY